MGDAGMFSTVLANGQDKNVVAQLVAFYELNNQKGVFAVLWDGTKCPVRDLKQYTRYTADDPNNRKAEDPQLLIRSEGFQHHLFLFDHIAQCLLTFQLGSLILLEGVRVSFMKRTNQLYLTCKGRVGVLDPNDRRTLNIKERLNIGGAINVRNDTFNSRINSEVQLSNTVPKTIAVLPKKEPAEETLHLEFNENTNSFFSRIRRENELSKQGDKVPFSNLMSNASISSKRIKIEEDKSTSHKRKII